MKWSTLLGLSVHDKSLPFDRTCCLDKSELETCLRFLVCVFLCHATVVTSNNNGSRSFSFLVLQLFSSMLFTNSSTFDTSSTSFSVHSMSCTFMFFSTRGILRVHSCSGNLCFQWFFVFIVSHLTSSRCASIGSMASQCVPDPCSAFSSDIRAQCSTTIVSWMLRTIHNVGLCGCHSFAQKRERRCCPRCRLG